MRATSRGSEAAHHNIPGRPFTINNPINPLNMHTVLVKLWNMNTERERMNVRTCVHEHMCVCVKFSMKDVVKQPNGQLCFSSLCSFLSCTCRKLWQRGKTHTQTHTHTLSSLSLWFLSPGSEMKTIHRSDLDTVEKSLQDTEASLSVRITLLPSSHFHHSVTSDEPSSVPHVGN